MQYNTCTYNARMVNHRAKSEVRFAVHRWKAVYCGGCKSCNQPLEHHVCTAAGSQKRQISAERLAYPLPTNPVKICHDISCHFGSWKYLDQLADLCRTRHKS